MRLILGCHKASSIVHLHTETKLLPVADHLAMLCTQFLASCLRSAHPSNVVVKLPPEPRKNTLGLHLKEMLSSCFSDVVSYHFHGGITPESDYTKIKTEIHTAAISTYLNSAPPNVVLGCKPSLDIHPSEQSLPRVYQTTNPQLRSGKCNRLQSYKFYIKTADDDECPICHCGPRSSAHLFSCDATPTDLTFWDLWHCPVEVAKFLSAYLSFNHIPAYLCRFHTLSQSLLHDQLA
jgi:hypothetical protein